MFVLERKKLSKPTYLIGGMFNAKDKAAGVNSRFPRLKYIKIDRVRELAEECRSGDASGPVRIGAVARQIDVHG
jgi:hypothetical protein